MKGVEPSFSRSSSWCGIAKNLKREKEAKVSSSQYKSPLHWGCTGNVQLGLPPILIFFCVVCCVVDQPTYNAPPPSTSWKGFPWGCGMEIKCKSSSLVLVFSTCEESDLHRREQTSADMSDVTWKRVPLLLRNKIAGSICNTLVGSPRWSIVEVSWRTRRCWTSAFVQAAVLSSPSMR